MKPKYTIAFKKDPKPTGPYATGHPNPRTAIKLNRKLVGYIVGPNFLTPYFWKVKFIVKIKKGMGWFTVKTNFHTEPEARQWIKDGGMLAIDKQCTLQPQED